MPDILANALRARQSVMHQTQATNSCMQQFANEKGIPAVIIFAGPNGSGKSTITEAIVNIPGQFSGEYINADDIARLLQDPISDDHRRNIKAAQIAQERRLQALHEGRDFAFETVMSTPEKVAL